MTEPPAAQPGAVPAASSPDFLLWREVDRLDRRIDENRQRLDILDQHGTRGVEALRNQVQLLASDIREHEQLHAKQTEQQITGRRWIVGVTVATVVPLYPAIAYLLTVAPPH